MFIKNIFNFFFLDIPLKLLENDEDKVEKLKEMQLPIYVICRRGILSVKGTHLLLQKGLKQVFNIDGGLQEWTKSIDNNFPFY